MLQADHVLGGDEGLLHHDDERRAAGEEASFLAVLLQQREGLAQAGRGVKVEVVHN